MGILVRVMVFACVLTCACADATPRDASGEVAGTPGDSVEIVSRGGGPVAAGPADSTGCLRGGTPRAEVRRILGEPDSVSFGAWFYGASEIQFGYGVVLEMRDRDGRLHLC